MTLIKAELQTARALMIIANLSGFIGYLMGNVGLSCTNFMIDNPIAKKRMAIAGAVAFGFCALCTGIAVREVAHIYKKNLNI